MADLRKPRGVLNLRRPNISFSRVAPHRNEHPPTELLFVIAGKGEQERWKLCAPNRAELDKWTAALQTVFGEWSLRRLDKAEPWIKKLGQRDEACGQPASHGPPSPVPSDKRPLGR
jgi:hypothetical protein